MARRAGYTKLLGEQASGEAGIVSVDVGFMFDDAIAQEHLANETAARNRVLLEAYGATGIQVGNLSYRDLLYLERVMGSKEYEANAKTYPFLTKLVSANIEPADASVHGFAPYSIVEVKAKRLGAKPVRVAFLGVAEPVPPPIMSGGQAMPVVASKKWIVKDPLPALKKYVPELRKKADLVIVLAYMPVPAAMKLGEAVGGIDAIIASNLIPLNSYNVQPAGDAILAPVFSQTKMLSELRLYTDPKKPGTLVNYAHRQVPLDDVIPDDPAAKAFMDKSHEEVRKAMPPKK